MNLKYKFEKLKRFLRWKLTDKPAINEFVVPSTLKDAMQELANVIPEKDKQFFRDNPDETLWHFGIGMHTRNSWRLWQADSPLVKEFKESTGLFGHGDDVWAIISEGAMAIIRNENVEQKVQERIDSIKEHWIKYDVDLKTGERKSK